MNRLARLIDGIRRARQPLSAWYQVRFDENEVSVSAQPPGRVTWRQAFRWEHVIRVCFEGNGVEASDGIYVFTSQRPQSYVIPTEADGGDAFVKELIRRGYFASDKFTEAVLRPYGLYCWPESETSSTH